MNFAEAVNLAKQNDEAGYTYLYEQTYSKALYVAIKYVKQEDRAYDVLQDAYIKAFKSLDQLDNPEKYVSWFHMIVARTALNDLKKRTPMLFTQLEKDDESYDISNMFRDEYTDNQPELVMEQKETSRLVQEIIDTLSDEQRTCVTMYYIQEFSVKEIAGILEVSENTVKSRLNYARKKIEEKVKQLENQGTKLYGIAPLPFFIMLMKKEATVKVAQGVSMQTYAVAMESIGVKTKAAMGISAATTTTESIGVGTKILIATATMATVVGGSVFGYIKLAPQDETTMADEAYEEYLSEQTILTGKEYNVYLEYDEENGVSNWTGDKFYDGIVAYAVEDVDNDDVNELVVVEGKETGEVSLCLLGYDTEQNEVVRLDEREIEAVPTNAHFFKAHWSLLKGEQTYLLYDYYYGFSDPGYRGFFFAGFSDDKIDGIAEYSANGTSWGDEPQTEYDNEIKKVFQLVNQSVNDEQLVELEYGVNFLDYIVGDVIGKIETTEVSSFEEEAAWQEKRWEYEQTHIMPEGWEKKLRLSVGRIQ